MITAPGYLLSVIDRTDPAQVAWAFLVDRLSYSWHDPHAGDGVRRAATYATRAKSAAMLTALPPGAADPTWLTAQKNQVNAAVVVNSIRLPARPSTATGTPITVTLTWTRTFGEAGTVPAVNSGVTTVTVLAQAGRRWAVDADNFGSPN